MVQNDLVSLLKVENWSVIVDRGRVSTHCVTEAVKKRTCSHSVNCQEPSRYYYYYYCV